MKKSQVLRARVLNAAGPSACVSRGLLPSELRPFVEDHVYTHFDMPVY